MTEDNIRFKRATGATDPRVNTAMDKAFVPVTMRYCSQQFFAVVGFPQSQSRFHQSRDYGGQADCGQDGRAAVFGILSLPALETHLMIEV